MEVHASQLARGGIEPEHATHVGKPTRARRLEGHPDEPAILVLPANDAEAVLRHEGVGEEHGHIGRVVHERVGRQPHHVARLGEHLGRRAAKGMLPDPFPLLAMLVQHLATADVEPAHVARDAHGHETLLLGEMRRRERGGEVLPERAHLLRPGRRAAAAGATRHLNARLNGGQRRHHHLDVARLPRGERRERAMRACEADALDLERDGAPRRRAQRKATVLGGESERDARAACVEQRHQRADHRRARRFLAHAPAHELRARQRRDRHERGDRDQHAHGTTGHASPSRHHGEDEDRHRGAPAAGAGGVRRAMLWKAIREDR